MNSNLANAAQRALVEATQRLDPEDRLLAFLAHSRLMAELHRAGREIRRSRHDHDTGRVAQPAS
jgi:hypothetical protein